MKRAPVLAGNFFCQEKFARAVTNRIASSKVKFLFTKKNFSDETRAVTNKIFSFKVQLFLNKETSF